MITLTWFLVECPGISMVSSPSSPMKSHERVVCNFLFKLGNTETTPGISVQKNQNVVVNLIFIPKQSNKLQKGYELTSNLRSLLISQLSSKTSEAMSITIKVRGLCLLDTVNRKPH